jgi:DNA gyrase subunit A
MKIADKTGDVVGVVFVEDDKDLMCLTSIGKMIRVDMASIRKTGRAASGVTIVKVANKDEVVSIAKCPKDDEEVEPDNIDEIEE